MLGEFNRKTSSFSKSTTDFQLSLMTVDNTETDSKPQSCSFFFGSEEGIEYTVDQLHEYMSLGVEGIHLYALNKYEDVTRLVKESGIVDL